MREVAEVAIAMLEHDNERLIEVQQLRRLLDSIPVR